MPTPTNADTFDNAMAVSLSAPLLNANLNIGGVGFGVSDGEYLPIVKVAPVYPNRALTRGLEGDCILEFTVTRAGSVEDVMVVECTSGLAEAGSLEVVRSRRDKTFPGGYSGSPNTLEPGRERCGSRHGAVDAPVESRRGRGERTEGAGGRASPSSKVAVPANRLTGQRVEYRCDPRGSHGFASCRSFIEGEFTFGRASLGRMASHNDEPRRRSGVIRLSALILAVGAVGAVGVAVPVGAQESLDVVDSLALAGRADEARTALESWWENQRLRSSRRDRQRGLWMRAVLTVDPRMAGLDFQRLVLEYPGGSHSDEALLRLGLINAAAEDLPRAARYFRTLVTDYPRSAQRRRAQDWLAEHLVAVEEAEAAQVEVLATEVGALVAEVDSLELEVDAPELEVDAPEAEVDPRDRAETVSTRYSVQVGAFESEERARELLASVNASGFRARIVRVPGSPLLHVRIGEFGEFVDRSGAVELMNRVRRRGHEATLAEDVAGEEPIQ